MVTAVVSDLHLGTRSGADLLSRENVRRVLMRRLEDVDQVVLLGDSIDLRAGPPREAMVAASAFFTDLGAAVGSGRVVVVAGNHDHQLALPWLRRRAAGAPLGLEQVSRPRPGDPLAWLAGRMPGTEVLLAYPGIQIRRDVYATHGHYLDCHNRVPTFECMARAAVELLLRRPRGGYRAPQDYEDVLTPVYRAIYRVTQSRRTQAAARLARRLVRTWERRALGRDEAGVELRRPGLAAMARVVDRLGIDASHVIFGHLHRPGPVPGDGAGWVTEGGRRLVNTGCWVYEPVYLGATPADSVHWPGTCVLVGDEGPPALEHLLQGMGHPELAPRG